jgi:integrase
VTVFFNHLSTEGIKLGEPALFLEPSMQILEEPTAFLRDRCIGNGAGQSPRTWASLAYSLAGWFDYLTEVGLADWSLASRDDLIGYRDAYLGAISPKTGAAYATGTIANRMAAIQAFYGYAGERGWYVGSILCPVVLIDGPPVPLDRDALAHARRGRRARAGNGLQPRRRPNRTAVRPFSAAELRAFLPALGGRASERGAGDQRPSRDRLIGDIGVFVGLRNDEIHQLTKYQFLSLHPDPDAPYANQALTVVGKGRISRTVAIPNWLVQDALAYVADERMQAVRASGLGRPPAGGPG